MLPDSMMPVDENSYVSFFRLPDSDGVYATPRFLGSDQPAPAFDPKCLVQRFLKNYVNREVHDIFASQWYTNSKLNANLLLKKLANDWHFSRADAPKSFKVYKEMENVYRQDLERSGQGRLSCMWAQP